MNVYTRKPFLSFIKAVNWISEAYPLLSRLYVKSHALFPFYNQKSLCVSLFYVYLSSNKLILRHLAYIILALACLCGCDRGAKPPIMPDTCRLLPGDVVFRKGEGLTSHLVAHADKAGIYSHVGIVVDSAGVPMIVHAVPGEPDFDGDPDRVKMDTPQKFFSAVNASAGEVRRLRGRALTARRAAAYALGMYGRGVLFDHGYNDADSTRVYCCELVDRAYQHAGVALTSGERHVLDFPGFGTIRCTLPSDILGSPLLVKVASF